MIDVGKILTFGNIFQLTIISSEPFSIKTTSNLSVVLKPSLLLGPMLSLLQQRGFYFILSLILFLMVLPQANLRNLCSLEINL